jgi:voltage-gated potassium channel
MDQPERGSPPAAETPSARRRTPFARALDRFLSNPSSGRNAILLIVLADLVTVVIGGAIIWTVDRQEYAQLTEAFWYILQTITTVGYGDVTPTAPIGRFVGAAVMLLGIAFLSILTATITSSFIEARQSERLARDRADELAHRARLEAQLAELIARLDRLERRAGGSPDRGDA